MNERFNIWFETLKVRNKDKASRIEELRSFFEDAWDCATASKVQELQKEIESLKHALYEGHWYE